MPYLRTVKPKFETTTVIFEISTFKFVKMQSSMLTEKNIKFWTESALCGFQQQLRICLNAKYFVKQKIFNFGTKNTLFWLIC